MNNVPGLNRGVSSGMGIQEMNINNGDTEVTKLTNQLCSNKRESRQPQLLSTVAFGALASITANLRLWLRQVHFPPASTAYLWKHEGRFNQDDWAMVVINFFLLIFSTLGALTVAEGYGLDAWDVDNLPLALGLFFWDEIVYILILGLCKISMLTFYLRIFPSYKFRITCYILLAWVTLYTIVIMLLSLLQCIPISINYFGWGKDGGRDGCLDLNAQAYASASTNITTDVIILLLPIPWLVRLRVSLKKKMHVLFMFSLGFFICVCSIIRIFTVKNFTDDSRNPTRDFVDITYWTAIEAYVSIIVPNLPSIRSLLSRKFPTLFGLDSQNTGHRNYEPPNPPPDSRNYERASRSATTQNTGSVELGSMDKTFTTNNTIVAEEEGYFSNSRIGGRR
ncbi:hypothetical protein VTL71DRAFT_6440 [Oculimacula yallundae]|uniref:Rhodopsin domain-containing protein n=1 Tax=Oculimacula yallundae TaxID=86028 RepID=A0ABR4BWY6_9HELO